jgi:hypothetical protein
LRVSDIEYPDGHGGYAPIMTTPDLGRLAAVTDAYGRLYCARRDGMDDLTPAEVRPLLSAVQLLRPLPVQGLAPWELWCLGRAARDLVEDARQNGAAIPHDWLELSVLAALGRELPEPDATRARRLLGVDGSSSILEWLAPLPEAVSRREWRAFRDDVVAYYSVRDESAWAVHTNRKPGPCEGRWDTEASHPAAPPCHVRLRPGDLCLQSADDSWGPRYCLGCALADGRLILGPASPYPEPPGYHLAMFPWAQVAHCLHAHPPTEVQKPATVPTAGHTRP